MRRRLDWVVITLLILFLLTWFFTGEFRIIIDWSDTPEPPIRVHRGVAV